MRDIPAPFDCWRISYGGVFEAGGLEHEVPTRLRAYPCTVSGNASLAKSAMDEILGMVSGLAWS